MNYTCLLWLVIMSTSLCCMDAEKIATLWKCQDYSGKKVELGKIEQKPSIKIKCYDNTTTYQVLRNDELISSFDISVFDSLNDPYLKKNIDWDDFYPSSNYALNKDGTLLAITGPRIAFIAKIGLSSCEVLNILSQCSKDDAEKELCVHCGQETNSAKMYYSWITMNDEGTEIIVKSKKYGVLKFTVQDIKEF